MKSKKVVWSEPEWEVHREIVKLSFPCPECNHVTVRHKEGGPFQSITCKGCKKKFELRYGEPDEDWYQCFFCQHIYYDYNLMKERCPKCKLSTQFDDYYRGDKSQLKSE